MKSITNYITEAMQKSVWNIEKTHKFCGELCEFMEEMNDSWEDYFDDDEEAIEFFDNLQSNKNDDLVNDLLVRFIDYISFHKDDFDKFEYDINNIPDKAFKIISNVSSKIANCFTSHQEVDFNKIWSKVKK